MHAYSTTLKRNYSLLRGSSIEYIKMDIVKYLFKESSSKNDFCCILLKLLELMM